MQKFVFKFDAAIKIGGDQKKQS